MSKPITIGFVLGAATLGFVGGVALDRVMAGPNIHSLAAVSDSCQLRNSIFVLKKLDEGKTEAAKADLERTLHRALETAPRTLAQLDSADPLRRELGLATDLGRRMLADRTKPLDQLMRETVR